MLRSFHWHPVLLAVYPVLALLSHNIASVRPRAAFGPMALAAVALLIVVGWLLARWNHEAVRLNRILDASAIALVVAAMIPIVGSELRPATHLPDDGNNLPVATPLGYLPDIYVIVLDAFGSADILQANSGVDLTGPSRRGKPQGAPPAMRVWGCQAGMNVIQGD